MAAMEDSTGAGAVSREDREDRAGGAAAGSGMEAPGGVERSGGAPADWEDQADQADRAGGAPGAGMEAPGGGEDQADRAAGAGMKAPGGGEDRADQADRAGGAPGAGMRAPGGGQDRADRADRAGGAAGVCRLKLFNKVLDRSLKKFIDDANFQRFAKTFHPLYQKNPKVMETIHKQFIADLQRAIQEDISRLVEEGELQYKLDELDKMEEAAKNNTEPAWRPSGVPEEDLCRFVMPYYLKQEAYLRQKLKALQAENAALAQRVQSGREAIASTELRIATAVDKWKETVKDSRKLALSLCPAETFDV